MRVALWVLGAEVLAFDVGRSPQAEEESGAASGGQFELGFQGADVEAGLNDVLFELRRIKRGRGDGPMGFGS